MLRVIPSSCNFPFSSRWDGPKLLQNQQPQPWSSAPVKRLSCNAGYKVGYRKERERQRFMKGVEKVRKEKRRAVGEIQRLDYELRRCKKFVADVCQDEDKAGVWKWKVRQRVWELLELEDAVKQPRPVYHRTPNFEGAHEATLKLAELPAFKEAQYVMVGPDVAQKRARLTTLRAGKQLLVPEVNLSGALLCKINPEGMTYQGIRGACVQSAFWKIGKRLTIDDEFKVDLIVLGSVAVDPRTGARLGRGEGLSDIEYGVLRDIGAVDDSTLVVTTVHDKQLVDDIQVDKMLPFDVPVDVIITPTQTIYTNTNIPKPTGIIWDMLSPERCLNSKVLKRLKAKIEKETGKTLKLGPSQKLAPPPPRPKLPYEVKPPGPPEPKYKVKRKVIPPKRRPKRFVPPMALSS